MKKHFTLFIIFTCFCFLSCGQERNNSSIAKSETEKTQDFSPVSLPENLSGEYKMTKFERYKATEELTVTVKIERKNGNSILYNILSKSEKAPRLLWSFF